MTYLFPIFIFLFGLAVGSFLNVVIYRLRTQENALKGRSCCPYCHHQLAWFDLIPVVSFLLLGGKCRYCKKNISRQYPIVETATGLLFLLIFLASRDMAQPDNLQLIDFLFLLAISCLLLVIFVYDLKHYIIPNEIVYPAIGIAFAWRIFEVFPIFRLLATRAGETKNWASLAVQALGEGGAFGFPNPLVNGAVAALIASGFFLLLFLASRGKWIGFGDVKLGIFMGLFLGFPNIFVALFFAFLIGAIIGVILMGARKKGLQSEIPFGPFLILGVLIAYLAGEEIAQWYFSSFAL